MPWTEAAWKWTYLVLGRPAPGGSWHEVPGRTMCVEATDGCLLDPVIDSEQFHGFERLEVALGPRVHVPVIAAPSRRALRAPR